MYYLKIHLKWGGRWVQRDDNPLSNSNDKEDTFSQDDDNEILSSKDAKNIRNELQGWKGALKKVYQRSSWAQKHRDFQNINWPFDL